MLRRWRPFSKIDAKSSAPVRVVKVSGLYNQRITIEYETEKGKLRKSVVHASQLIPFDDPYPEAQLIEVLDD